MNTWKVQGDSDNTQPFAFERGWIDAKWRQCLILPNVTVLHIIMVMRQLYRSNPLQQKYKTVLYANVFVLLSSINLINPGAGLLAHRIWARIHLHRGQSLEV